MNGNGQLAERKALLIAEAELHRMQSTLAWHEARSIIAPAVPASERSAGSRLVAATLIGLSLPLLGGGRLRKFLRLATLATTALRLVRAWRVGDGRPQAR